MSSLAAPVGQRPAPRRRGDPVTARRRMVGAAILVAGVLTVAVGWAGAQAQLNHEVAGHVMLEPGQTLWDVAVATAPDGVDPRRQMAALRELNGIDGAHVDAWMVVLVPAR